MIWMLALLGGCDDPVDGEIGAVALTILPDRWNDGWEIAQKQADLPCDGVAKRTNLTKKIPHGVYGNTVQIVRDEFITENPFHLDHTLVVLGAGNDALPNQPLPELSEGEDAWAQLPTVTLPAALFQNNDREHTLVVGGLNNGQLWDASAGEQGTNYGAGVDVYAPATHWKVLEQALGPDQRRCRVDDLTSGCGIMSDDGHGTSLAAPQVASIAALLASHTTLAPAAIRGRILGTSTSAIRRPKCGLTPVHEDIAVRVPNLVEALQLEYAA